jgi:hypothetical protein
MSRRPAKRIRQLMMLDAALFAQLEGLNPLNPTAPVSKTGGLVVKDLLLIIGACLVLALVLFAGARLYVQSKHRRRHHGRRGRQSAAVGTQDMADAREESEERGRHRRRRRRRVREHRPRNPTLAETGGLPPQKSPPPSQQAL